jgi:hypothetical protein
MQYTSKTYLYLFYAHISVNNLHLLNKTITTSIQWFVIHARKARIFEPWIGILILLIHTLITLNHLTRYDNF